MPGHQPLTNVPHPAARTAALEHYWNFADTRPSNSCGGA
jgi:hypothetical protein